MVESEGDGLNRVGERKRDVKDNVKDNTCISDLSNWKMVNLLGGRLG